MSSDEQRPGDSISGSVSGPVQGQVAIGKDIQQRQEVGQMTLELTQAERAELKQAFADLRSQVEAEAPPEARDAALERVGELEEAVDPDAEEPDTTTLAYVKRWFKKNVPTLAGAVVGVLVNPVLGKIVQSAGDAATGELQRAIEE